MESYYIIIPSENFIITVWLFVVFTSKFFLKKMIFEDNMLTLSKRVAEICFNKLSSNNCLLILIDRYVNN